MEYVAEKEYPAPPTSWTDWSDIENPSDGKLLEGTGKPIDLAWQKYSLAFFRGHLQCDFASTRGSVSDEVALVAWSHVQYSSACPGLEIVAAGISRRVCVEVELMG